MFVTGACPIVAPTAVTTSATNVTATSATLNATINPNGSSTSALFDYGFTTGYGFQVAATPAPGAGTSPVAVSAAITSLNCNTTYHVRASATNAAGNGVGADVTLTTAACSTPALAATDGFDPGANGQINAVAIQPDGKIVVGGSFTMLGGG